MRAFVEILSAIVRVGPEAGEYGNPFEFAVAVSSVDGKTAIVKALVAETPFRRAHVAAAIAALKRDIPGFLHAECERIKSP